ncbi:MAG: type II toxin-antitoxin system RelE/ParE family toxin [Opitutaceae bacterium]|nr:type II toxin-antitoxin system RelE/ParE family toxin [Opitutaceae bacterium]
MKPELELTPAALADLRSIRAYTLERWGAEQEAAYLDRMWDKFEALLADSSLYRFRPDLFPGCQIAAEEKHVILFCVSKSTLQIVRVLHSAMDFKRHLPGA